MEIWKDVKGHEGCYQVSNLGNVESFKYGKRKTLKPFKGTTGYYLVCMYKDKKRSTHKVHKLVAIAFLNHIPCGFKLVVNHKDFNRLNNKAENLELITNRENTIKDTKRGVSKYVGVCWDKSRGKWIVQLKDKGIKYNLGRYRNEKFAAAVYLSKLNELTTNRYGNSESYGIYKLIG